MRSVTCTNNESSTMKFDSSSFSPFILASIDGIYEHQENVSISENTMIDGGTYQGSVASIRNIIITLQDRPDNFYNIRNRQALYILFEKGKQGTLIYEENGTERVIDYYVESIIRNLNRKRPNITISLLCPDPFFYDKSGVTVQMANWISAWEFEHEFVAEGEELGYRSAERLQNIVNDSAADNIGMTITIAAIGAATNISVTRVESDQSITVGYTGKTFSMSSGDILVITTGTGNKHVYLTSNGVTTEVNEYLTEDSVFIQLRRGDNNIGYSAETGESNLVVSVQYRLKYEGA